MVILSCSKKKSTDPGNEPPPEPVIKVAEVKITGTFLANDTIWVPKQDSTTDYYLYATAYDEDGNAISDSKLYFTWSISDPSIVRLDTSRTTNNAKVEITALKDCFDNGESSSPTCEITVSTPQTLSKPIIIITSYPPVTVVGVVNPEGTWRFDGTSFITYVNAEIDQNGKIFSISGFAYHVENCTIIDDKVDYTTINGWHHTGTVNSDRDHMEREATVTVGDTTYIESWFADKQ